jgi:cellulose synthase/poly-beta-1,6-N-acetylglucosamine synthase-like glycosyltransferase
MYRTLFDPLWIKKIISKLSIVIPVFNEGKKIHLILDKNKAVHLPDNIEKEIIIVDDDSNNGMREKCYRITMPIAI